MERNLTDNKNSLLELQSLLKRLRSQTTSSFAGPNVSAELDLTRIGYLDGGVVPRAVITLRSLGCAWARKGGGCTMCGHLAGAIDAAKADPDNLYNQFLQQFEQVEWSRYPVLCLYNGGSLLNREELPKEVFDRIVEKIIGEKRIREFVVETRAEYVQADMLEELAARLGSCRLTIAMGLETARDDVLALCVHKGQTLPRFRKACEAIVSSASLRLYVLVKPPWLTEAEAVDDAANAVLLAQELGANQIHLEPLTIQQGTLVDLLWRNDGYRMPWLWSLVEILRRVAPQRVYISPFAHFPRPVAIPHNCGTCDDILIEALIEKYNRDFDIAVFDSMHCDCFSSWQEEMERVDLRSIEQRVSEELASLEGILDNQPK